MSETAELRVMEEEPASEQGPSAEQGSEQAGAETKAPQRRERSTIGFPYDDLDSALVILREIHHTHGGQATMAQLAGGLGQTTKSGAFRIKVSAARLFGFVSLSQSILMLTERGTRTLDATSEGQARAEGFLQVPLYAALYERFKDGTLPDDNGLEAAIRDLGVTPKQVTTARQVFHRSAQQAGFFRFGNRKLVLPSMNAVSTPPEPRETGHEPESRQDSAESKSDDLVKHPFILGLLRELPDPDEEFPADARATWLDAAKISFDLIYGKVT